MQTICILMFCVRHTIRKTKMKTARVSMAPVQLNISNDCIWCQYVCLYSIWFYSVACPSTVYTIHWIIVWSWAHNSVHSYIRTMCNMNEHSIRFWNHFFCPQLEFVLIKNAVRQIDDTLQDTERKLKAAIWSFLMFLFSFWTNGAMKCLKLQIYQCFFLFISCTNSNENAIDLLKWRWNV